MEKTDFTRKRAQVIAKAWTDPTFRKALVADPKQIVAREFAIDIPADLAVTILEDTADTVNLVLVDPADLPEEEKTGPQAAILAKAWTDPAFKKALLADPAAALTAALAAPMRPGVSIKVVEQTDDHVYGVIPMRPSSLDDADLEKVAGGMSRNNEDLLIGSTVAVGLGVAFGPEVGVPFEAGVILSHRGTAFDDGKIAGKAIYHGGEKAGKAIGHACKKAFHGW